MYAAMLAAEAIKTAQEMHGVTAISAAQMRDGMENLEMTEEKMAALGLPNFGPEFSVSCENHGGNGFGAVSQWDAEAGEFDPDHRLLPVGSGDHRQAGGRGFGAVRRGERDRAGLLRPDETARSPHHVAAGHDLSIFGKMKVGLSLPVCDGEL